MNSSRQFRRPHLGRVSVIAILLSVSALSAQSPMVGAYTEEQAALGEKTFGGKCVECHEKKDVSGVDFRKKWNGRTARDLYQLIRTTMPDDNPGSMTPEQYLNIVTYLLKLNGLPSGTTMLSADSTVLEAAKLDFSAAPPSHDGRSFHAFAHPRH